MTLHRIEWHAHYLGHVLVALILKVVQGQGQSLRWRQLRQRRAYLAGRLAQRDLCFWLSPAIGVGEALSS